MITYSVLYVFIIAITWCLITGEFSAGQGLLGIGFGLAFVLITQSGRQRHISIREIPRRFAYFVYYMLVLIPYDVAHSNIDLARRLLRREPDINPGVIRLHIGDVSQATSALVAHAITMTPGELVIDYSEDGRTIYIHLIDITDVDTKRSDFWRLYSRILEKVFS